jgi:hypothetical protein
MIKDPIMEAGIARGPVPVRETAPEPEHWPRLEDSLKSILFGAEALSSGPPPVKPFQSPKDKKLRPGRPNTKAVLDGDPSEADMSDFNKVSMF